MGPEAWRPRCLAAGGLAAAVPGASSPGGPLPGLRAHGPGPGGAWRPGASSPGPWARRPEAAAVPCDIAPDGSVGGYVTVGFSQQIRRRVDGLRRIGTGPAPGLRDHGLEA